MTELTLQFDNKSNETIEHLMKHYGIKSKAALISKAISLLKTAAYIDMTNGNLIAKKNNKETKILV